MTVTSAKGIYACPVISQEEVARGIFLMRLRAPEIAAAVLPGQFVNIQVQAQSAGQISPLLRRPFSVCQVDRAEGSIAILWKIVGQGTRILASHRPGAVLSVIGPLGNGYQLPTNVARLAIVAGGLGIAPMPLLAVFLQQRGFAFDALLGARTKAELWGENELSACGGRVTCATDDGSAGHHGFVTDLLQDWLQRSEETPACQIFACGPMPMLQRVAEICRRANVVAQVAIETIMGCGFGICMGCNTEPAEGVQNAGRYLLACIDGPVFESNKIRYESVAH
ncbi:dihydroorotate dehydrogenase electron transfer subunit [bacterium]|nr:dihydroorotate dehydrogenase electron transfer subunit [bacterium]